MLAYFLAILVGMGSAGFYLATLFCPELYRKPDPIWSGVGLFYGLVLWFEAPRLSGGLLLGQFFSILLLGWFGVETLVLRRQVTPEGDRTPLPEFLAGLLPTASQPTETAWIEIRQDFSPLESDRESSFGSDPEKTTE